MGPRGPGHTQPADTRVPTFPGKGEIRLSLRGTVNVLTVLMFGLALVAAVAQGLTASSGRRAAVRLSGASMGLRAALEVESNLQEFNREAYLWLATGDANARDRRDAALKRIGVWLDVSRAHSFSDAESALIDETEHDVRTHVENYRQLETEAIPVLEGVRRATATLAPAASVADRLVALNAQQADEAYAASERSNRLADMASIFLALTMGGVALLGGLLVHRAIYRPVLALRAAMHRFAEGDPGARAETEGPRELAEVARDFNELADRLARQQRERLAFVGAVAHDLKNPLTALKAGTSLPLKAGDEAALERRLSLIRRQVDRMDRMLGDFLDVSRITAGQFELRPEPVDLTTVARHAVELFRDSADQHELELSAPSGQVVVNADPVRIEQVLQNLISNAIKYSPAGGRVDVRVKRQNGSAVLEVEDHGVGISPTDRERIFEPFRRLDTKVEIPGVGLGLSVTRKLVEGHGGHIAVDSTPGRGSTFRVELPAVGTA
jgi:signal transduction histidine kinase